VCAPRDERFRGGQSSALQESPAPVRDLHLIEQRHSIQRSDQCAATCEKVSLFIEPRRGQFPAADSEDVALQEYPGIPAGQDTHRDGSRAAGETVTETTLQTPPRARLVVQDL